MPALFRTTGLAAFLLASPLCCRSAELARRDFIAYIRESRQLSFTNIAATLFTMRAAKGNAAPLCLISPDRQYLAALTVQSNQWDTSQVRIFSLSQTSVIAELRPVSSNELSLVPLDLMWSPESRELYVFMRFSDTGYGVWVPFSLERNDFTAEGKKEMSELLRYNKDNRPDYMSTGRQTLWQPVWDSKGRRYASLDHALKAGVNRFWQPPLFVGTARKSIAIKMRWYEVLIEQGIGRTRSRSDDPYVLPTARAHVYCEGELVHDMEVAASTTPNLVLLFYERGDLVLLGGAQDEPRGYRPWKVSLPESKLCRLLAVEDSGQETLVLVIRSSDSFAVHLLKITEGMR